MNSEGFKKGGLLRCPLCLDSYSRPRSLPECKHSFCTTCIESFVQSNIADSLLLSCPVCSIPFKGPVDIKGIKTWLKQLPLNYQLILILQEKNEKKLFPCEPCDTRCDDLCETICTEQSVTNGSDSLDTDEPNDTKYVPHVAELSNAVKFCPQCMEAYCQSCSDVHRSSRASMSHTLVSTESANFGKIVLGTTLVQNCPYHYDKQIEFYCNNHNEFICSECAIFRHKSCGLVVESPTRSKQLSVDTLVKEVETLFQKVHTRLDMLTKIINEQNDELRRKTEHFKQEVTRMRQVVNSKLDLYERQCQTILDKIETKANETIKTAFNTVKVLSVALETEEKLFKATVDDTAKSGIGVFCHSKKRCLEKIVQSFGSQINLPTLQFEHKIAKKFTSVLQDQFKIGSPEVYLYYMTVNNLKLCQSYYKDPNAMTNV